MVYVLINLLPFIDTMVESLLSCLSTYSIFSLGIFSTRIIISLSAISTSLRTGLVMNLSGLGEEGGRVFGGFGYLMY